MKISEVAEQLGVPTSTVRYYERVGLVPGPLRTASGYRDYDDHAVARLLFVTRAKRIGLSLEQIAEVLPIWDGANCRPTHEEMLRLVEEKRVDLLRRARELERFAEQLEEIRAGLEQEPPPVACRPDLSCCVPEAGDGVTVSISEPTTRRTRQAKQPA